MATHLRVLREIHDAAWDLHDMVDGVEDKVIEAQPLVSKFKKLVEKLENFPYPHPTSTSVAKLLETAQNEILDLDAVAERFAEMRGFLEQYMEDVRVQTEAFKAVRTKDLRMKDVSQHDSFASVARMARRRTENRVRNKAQPSSSPDAFRFSITGGQHPAMAIKSPTKLRNRIQVLQIDLKRNKNMASSVRKRKTDELIALQGLLHNKQNDLKR